MMRVAYTIIYLFFLSSNTASAYIDPGTGSFVLQCLAAAVIGGLFAMKSYWRRILNKFGLGKKKNNPKK
jgi:hypothetical protein